MTTATDATPTGQLNTMEDVFIEGAPTFWWGGVPQYSPDTDGYYWGVVGTALKPLYKVGCFTDFRLRDNIQMNDVRCDIIGVKATIQKRSYLEVSFNLVSMLPLSVLTPMLFRAGAATHNLTEHTEKAGIGIINNQLYNMVYFSKIYDPDNGDYVSFTGHRTQFVDAWEIGMTYGQAWTVGIKARLFADDTKPSAQTFATVIRYSPNAL